MQYIYIEFLGLDEKGQKQHLVYDRKTKYEIIITQEELVADCEDVNWGDCCKLVMKREVDND